MGKTVIVSIILALSMPALSFADLGDLKKNVEQQEQQNEEHDDDNAKYDENQNSSGYNPVAAFFGEVFAALYKVNLFVDYDAHPYATEGRWFFDYPKTFDVDDNPIMNPDAKPFYFTAETYGVWAPGTGWGGGGSLRGKAWRFIGPELEWYTLADEHGNLFHQGKFGINVAMFQFDYLSMDAYGQFIMWSGIMERSGGGVGFIFRSMPFKPLVLTVRAGMQIFGNLNFSDCDFSAGLLLGAAEIFGGYRLDTAILNEWNSGGADFNGFYAGVRYWF